MRVKELPPKIKEIKELKMKESDLEEEIIQSEKTQFGEFISTGETVSPVIETNQEPRTRAEVRTPESQTRSEQEQEFSYLASRNQTAEQTYKTAEITPSGTLAERELSRQHIGRGFSMGSQTSALPESQMRQQLLESEEEQIEKKYETTSKRRRYPWEA